MNPETGRKRKLNKMTREQMQMVRKMHFVCAALFFIAGACVIAFPAMARDFGLSGDAIKIMGGAMMAAGIADFLLMRFIFKDLDRL